MPDFTRGTPTVTTEDDPLAEARVDLAGKILLVHQLGLALGTTAGRGVGFGLGASLGQQPQRLPGPQGDLLFDEP